MNKKLYVGNLSYQTSEEELKELFAEAGEVESVKIITDRYTGHSRGFGFVEMATPEAASKAIELFNGKVWMDRSLRVNEANPPQRRADRGDSDRGSDRRDR